VKLYLLEREILERSRPLDQQSPDTLWNWSLSAEENRACLSSIFCFTPEAFLTREQKKFIALGDCEQSLPFKQPLFFAVKDQKIIPASFLPDLKNTEKRLSRFTLAYLWSHFFSYPKEELLFKNQYYGLIREGCHYSSTHSEGIIFQAYSPSPLGIDCENKTRHLSEKLRIKILNVLRTHSSLDQTIHFEKLSSQELWTIYEAHFKWKTYFNEKTSKDTPQAAFHIEKNLTPLYTQGVLTIVQETILWP
jgi:hypothetical protein